MCPKSPGGDEGRLTWMPARAEGCDTGGGPELGRLTAEAILLFGGGVTLSLRIAQYK